MIKFYATNPVNNRTILGLILEEGNLTRLKAAMPIHFNAEEINLEKINCNEIIIMYYETKELAIENLKLKGFISDDTNIIQERKIKQ